MPAIFDLLRRRRRLRRRHPAVLGAGGRLPAVPDDLDRLRRRRRCSDLPHRGKDGAARFFAELAKYQFNEFDVTDLLVGANCVASRVLVELTAPSGVVIRDDVMHLWWFEDSGLVSGLRHYFDMAEASGAAWRATG